MVTPVTDYLVPYRFARAGVCYLFYFLCMVNSLWTHAILILGKSAILFSFVPKKCKGKVNVYVLLAEKNNNVAIIFFLVGHPGH